MATLNDRYMTVYQAKLALSANRYPDMAKAMKKLAEFEVDFTEEERNLLSKAYKNVIGHKRKSRRTFCDMEKKEKDHTNLMRIREYRLKIESEITDHCNDAIKMIDDHLLPFASTTESTIFFINMKADNYRYLAEIKSGDEREEAAEKSLKAYEEGIAIAMAAKLSVAHPARLGLALNLSVFYYDIMNSCKRACTFAMGTYDEATLELIKKRDYPIECSIIMQCLRDNVSFWALELENYPNRLC
ncbi:14-3-3-like protein GF14 omicron [Spinacia oleracea]|uniref:14-3-3-like protein GF14 omicron n=1 Tax=Spinacia oleracea TaxID=3562 RepID=A0A9R0IPE5_SPIOL|nr:14-3-3-like protein GF14 omicron [Spinacia oleracea]